jgi:hypothetical protein
MNPYTLTMLARQHQEAVALGASNAERRRPALRTSPRKRFSRSLLARLGVSNRGEAAAVTRRLANL